MSIDFADVHDELRAVARTLLADTPAGSGRAADWSLLAGSGWLGLEAPEALGGDGATFAEVAVILQELGRAATLSSYLGTVVLGVGTLDALGAQTGRDELLRKVASGDVRVAVALATGDAVAPPAGGAVVPPFRLEPSAGGFRMSGHAEFVPDAGEADRLLLLASDGGAGGGPGAGAGGGPVIVAVEPGHPGLAVTAQPVLDDSRRFGVVTAVDVEVDAGSVWRFGRDGGAEADAEVRGLLDRGALAVACDSLGVAEAMLEATVAYAGTRQQFGRPIGSFQAVKHACADMAVQVAVGQELLLAAVRALSSGDPDASTAVSMAKSYVCAAAVEVAGQAMQLHGGIGYAWESGVHVYLKRAVLGRSLFGAPSAHRARLARRFL
ncbi:MAG: acyl-CoA dehydrogenase family protein [Frankia sp.]